MRAGWAVPCVLGALALPGAAAAQAFSIQGDSASLSLGGYALTAGGLERLPFTIPATPAEPPTDHLGLSESVLRLEWKARLGDRVGMEVHQRAFLRVSSQPLALGGARVGLGSSAVPPRSVDLRSVAYDEDRLTLEHDLDRLVVRATATDLDVSVGRQAITWGVAELFPVADLWTTLSPFELDTSQKRGVDAVRVLWSHSRALELEAVVADRGTWRDLSFGVRAASYRELADFYVAVTKQWRELLALGGVSATAGSFKLRAEAAAPYDLDERSFARPRIVVGADWLHTDLTVTLEAHYNGTGVTRASRYAAQLASPALAHGETYLLGRWYAGGAVTWKPSELFRLAASVITNLRDPSAMIGGSFTYELTQETDLSLGLFRGVGASPRVAQGIELRSELGSYGGFYYLAMSAYF